MFKSANEISGVDKDTLPTELIPLNAIQLSRGLLNFTVMQSRLNWILPFWARKQYDPSSTSFVPRSHMGLSMNITHRNWTAVGSMECSTEPIVDPRGLVTPFKDGWSIDVWVITDDDIFFPSYSDEVTQELIESLPVVRTQFNCKDFILTLKTFAQGSKLIHKAAVENNTAGAKKFRIVFAVRPFNPEGISLINFIDYLPGERVFLINKKSKIAFNAAPSLVYCSSFKDGDSAEIFTSRRNGRTGTSVNCKDGMASSVAVFDNELKAGESFTVECMCNLSGYYSAQLNTVNEDEVIRYWENLLSKGTAISTPDDKINSAVKSALTTLLLLVDENEITPGPFTYHQFWFRDASFMIWALDRFGYTEFTQNIINSFEHYLSNSGYFRSQKGEWDSNGQVLWTVFQHSKYSYSRHSLESIFDLLFKAVKWIDATRLKSPEFKDTEFYGLLPAGMSAEHLGLADYYFWDNAWSIAGIQAFIEICNLLSQKEEKEFAEKLLGDYMNDFQSAVNNVQAKFGIRSIPASPARGIDCGMIGSISVCYPLQIFNFDEPGIAATLKTIEEKYFYDGMFFQHYIHSGMNAYLTLQTAHAFLYTGDGRKFFEILSGTLSHLSPTLNFPEAINPLTGGGCMGDGHHGWAAAELLLALNDAFAFERREPAAGINSVLLLYGIPDSWFMSGKNFSIEKAKISSGVIGISVKPSQEGILISIKYEAKTKDSADKWYIKLPGWIKPDGRSEAIISVTGNNRNENVLELKPGTIELNLLQNVTQAY